MPEDNSASTLVNNDTQQSDLAYYESIAFNGIVPTEAQQQSNEQGNADNTQGALNTNANAAPEERIANADDFIKSELGFDNLDAIKTALQEYNTLKNNPQKAEPQFANDEAKRWYEYFVGGKEDDLYKSLSARQQIKNIDTLDDQQRLKLYIKMNNPLFDDELVEDEYKTLYTVNEDNFKDALNEVDTLSLRKEQLRAKQRIMNDAQKANEFFTQYKTKIELSPIQQATPIDNDYEAYKASNAKQVEHYQKDVQPAIKNLKSTDVGMQVKIADTENQMDFNVSIDVTPEDLEQAKNDALNLSDYLDKELYQDGKFIAPQKYAQMLLKAKNFDKYAQTIARQAVMAERKRVQLRNAQGGNGFNNGGGMRDYDLGKQDELKSLEQMAFPGQN